MISGSVVFSGRMPGGLPAGRFSSSAIPEWKYFEVRIAGIDAIVPADGALANAWLGRGLLKILQSFNWFTFGLKGYPEGLQDLQVAATLEPQRSVLRSYLGKAFAEKHDLKHARQELDLARKHDPNDPTGWLYSALLDVQENRDNEAVRDLEKSKELNENRSLFRSQLLLDQDQAVRGAGLEPMGLDLIPFALVRAVGTPDI